MSAPKNRADVVALMAESAWLYNPQEALNLLFTLEAAGLRVVPAGVLDAVEKILSQLTHSDAYAAQENRDPLPSVWEIQNSHLRDYAKAALRAASPFAPDAEP